MTARPTSRADGKPGSSDPAAQSGMAVAQRTKGTPGANSLSIAAASIVAKVTRDKMMADYDQEFPGYAFAKNAGYGTKDHLTGIDNFGVTPIHRRSFEPIKSIIKSR